MKTKYDLKDIVYIIFKRHEVTEVDCKYCSGTGYYYSPNGLYQQGCDHCYGKKKVFEKGNFIWVAPSHEIFIDEIIINEDGISYNDDNNDGALEDECFFTLEEAQTECDKRNKVQLNEIPK